MHLPGLWGGDLDFGFWGRPYNTREACLSRVRLGGCRPSGKIHYYIMALDSVLRATKERGEKDETRRRQDGRDRETKRRIG